MAEKTCQRITGKAFEPHYWGLSKERQGPRREVDEVNTNRSLRYVREQRPQAVYDVLCGSPVRWVVQAENSDPAGPSMVVCGSCVSAVADQFADDLVVTNEHPVVRLERI